MASIQEPILASFVELPPSDMLLLEGLIAKAHVGNGSTDYQPSDQNFVGIGGVDGVPDGFSYWLYNDSLWSWTNPSLDKGPTGATGANGTNGRNGSPFTKTKTADQSLTANTTWYDITDLSHDVQSGRNYVVHCHVLTSAAATISGNQIVLALNGPSKSHFACMVRSPQSAMNTYGIVFHTDYDGYTSSFAAPTTAATGYPQDLFAVVKPSADGVLQLRGYRSSATDHPKVLTGSFMRLYDLGT